MKRQPQCERGKNCQVCPVGDVREKATLLLNTKGYPLMILSVFRDSYP